MTFKMNGLILTREIGFVYKSRENDMLLAFDKMRLPFKI